MRCHDLPRSRREATHSSIISCEPLVGAQLHRHGGAQRDILGQVDHDLVPPGKAGRREERRVDLVRCRAGERVDLLGRVVVELGRVVAVAERLALRLGACRGRDISGGSI